MKQQIIFWLFVIVLLTNCSETSNLKSSEFLNTDNLETQRFIIDNSSDTILYSKSGIKIVIQKNSFKETEDDFIKLEFKEAIEIEDIVLGGLLTVTTDGKPLESNGMVFLNATTRASKPLKLKSDKSIEITISNATYKEGLKIFNSRQTKNGVITWETPIDLDIDEELVYLAEGKALFKNNCASCHNWKDFSKNSTGPPLGNIETYRDWNWIVNFTRNSQAMIAAGDTTATCIFNEYSKSVMTSFPYLSDKEIRQLYDFVKNESMIQKVPIDSSRFDLTCDINTISPQNIQDFFSFGDTSVALRNMSFSNSFFMKKLSWVNMDRFINDERVEPRDFFVELNNDTLNFDVMEIYLVFSTENVFLNARWNDGNKYYFTFKNKGTSISLPIGAKATILAIGKKEEKTYFKAKNITYGDKDVVKISPKITEENISDLIETHF